jgi:small multidrug resistance pump
MAAAASLLQNLISYLQRLPPDAPEWEVVPTFAASVQALAEQKLAERERGRNELRLALTDLRRETGKLFGWWGYEVAAWSADRCAWDRASAEARRVREWQAALLRHGDLLLAPSASLSEERTRRGLLDELETEIERGYAELRLALATDARGPVTLSDDAYPGPTGLSELPAEERLAPEQALGAAVIQDASPPAEIYAAPGGPELPGGAPSERHDTSAAWGAFAALAALPLFQNVLGRLQGLAAVAAGREQATAFLASLAHTERATLATLVTVGLTAVTVVGDYLLKRASGLVAPFASWWFFAGAAIYAATAFGWVFVMRHLSFANMGVVYAVSTVLLLALVGHLFLHESLLWPEAVGMVLAVTAVGLLARFA